MKTILKIVAGVLLVLVLMGAVVYGWASVTSSRTLARAFEIHELEFPIPFPLSEEELAELEPDAAQTEQLALERARERGGGAPGEGPIRLRRVPR